MNQKFSVAPIFSNHMVLQREKEIRVWGEGQDNDIVKVNLDGHFVETVVQDNKWMAILPSMQVGDPVELVVSCNEESVTFTDILIGDVWLCGGQSNMELELQNSKDGKEALEKANHSNIRLYYTLQQSFLDDKALEAERNNSWNVCNSDTAARITAVGYYFGRELNKELDVPIGIIGCNWGGTSAAAWISHDTLTTEKDSNQLVEDYEEAIKKYPTLEDYEKDRAQNVIDYASWKERADKLYAENPEILWGEVLKIAGDCPWPEPIGPKSPFRPAGLYETMLQRIVPLSLKGFIYYQGESDDHHPTMYGKLLTMLIDQWRRDFKDYELPFLFVQLPMFISRGDEDRKHWAVLREQQMRVHKTIKNTGLAVALDLGEFDNIHPLDKESVGYRLALQALYHVYKKDIVAYGPLYKNLVINKDEVELHFHNVENGFVLVGDEVNGFEVAGEDEVFYKASARIEKDRILVKANEVTKPFYVRYHWTNWDKVSIFNNTGVPLAPFRTNEFLKYDYKG